MTVESTSARGPRLSDLDALRGLAALAVVLFHFTTRYADLYGHNTDPGFEIPWGHYGVQLFFVISGFVIFMTLDRCASLSEFAVSRFSRLYPAYWAAIGLTTIVVLISGLDDFARTPGEILINLSMVQAFVQVASVDPVYWTLAVEFAFYCGAATLWGCGLRRVEPLLLAWLSLRWIWAFAPALIGVEPSWLLGALLIQEYIAFFAIGIVAYRLRSGAASPGWTVTVVAAALATIGVCNGAEQLLVAMIGAAAIFTVALARAPMISARPLVWLGAVSYSLYLLHQLIGFVVIGRLEAIGLPASAAIFITLAVVLALAALVTRWIEQPALRAIRRRHALRRRPVPTLETLAERPA